MKAVATLLAASVAAVTAFDACAAVLLPSVSSTGERSVAIALNKGNVSTQQHIINNISNVVHRGSPAVEQEKLAQTQRILLQIQNPTTLEIADVDWQNWLGEDEPFLTLKIKNAARMPATRMRLLVLDPSTGSTYASLKPYRSLKPSRTMQAVGDSISLDAGKEVSQPLIALSDVYKLHPEIRRTYPRACIFGSTLDAKDVGIVRDGRGFAATRTIPFAIRLTYEDAFGRPVEQMSFVFAKALLNWDATALTQSEGSTLPDVCRIPRSVISYGIAPD